MEPGRFRPRPRPTDKEIRPVDRREYADLSAMRLNAQAQKYDGFTPAGRVFGRTPEMPIGTADNPFFSDFTNPEDPTVARAQKAIAKLSEIENSSLESDFN